MRIHEFFEFCMATVFSLMAKRVVASVRVTNTGKPVRIMLGGLRAYAFTLKVRGTIQYLRLLELVLLGN